MRVPPHFPAQGSDVLGAHDLGEVSSGCPCSTACMCLLRMLCMLRMLFRPEPAACMHRRLPIKFLHKGTLVEGRLCTFTVQQRDSIVGSLSILAVSGAGRTSKDTDRCAWAYVLCTRWRRTFSTEIWQC